MDAKITNGVFIRYLSHLGDIITLSPKILFEAIKMQMNKSGIITCRVYSRLILQRYSVSIGGVASNTSTC